MHKTIEVSGAVKLERKISRYRAKISIEVNQNPYGDEEVSDLEEIKNQYYLALVENGVDVNKFVEDTFEFRTYNYQAEGTMLKYECESQKEISQLLDIKVPGIYINLLECKYIIDDESYDEITEAALEDAKIRANKIAAKIDKKVGAIVNLVDYRQLNDYWTTFNPYDEFFELKVVFELE
ncbi:SIMPL domain-containing protein [Aureibaculum sp. 2210JD6-5]|uniref:SIMPL domain-containing protein n=1 Tax=Aureibaculum sp. 2210JD6-5 TaxID=3103957 RepID=UPI002AAE3FED|nr:SIMPL domain-containing protein [Aureibaculum sp. 2210JD6-5]MDY7394290.1 SIMPL domain-containing protein [Aureibaculum sp. 2210JD6-5]